MEPNYRKTISNRYQKYDFFKNGTCTYCGRTADCLDHVPSMIISYISHPDVPHMIVPSCSLCNSLLGGRSLNTIYNRALFLLNRYELYYKSDLNIPEWEDCELKEMGPIMQQAIISSLKQKDAVENVLYHLDLVMSIWVRVATWNQSDFSAWLIKEK